MRHVLIADSHIHPFTQFSTGEGSTNSRMQRTLHCIREAIDFAMFQGITSVIHLGDVFHVRQRQQYEHFNAAYDTFRKCKERGIELTILMGNHDKLLKSEGGLTIDSFKDIANIIREPENYNRRGIANLWMVPYTSNFEQAVDWLNNIPDSKIVLHHLDIVGVDTGLGWISEIGVGKDNFSRFKLSLGGHYHKRQQILPNAWYMGCVCPQDFNCPDEPGYFCTLDDETGEVEWHINSAPKFTVFNPHQGQRDLSNCYVKILLDRSQQFDDWMKTTGAVGWNFCPVKPLAQVIARQKGINLETNHEEVVKTFAQVHHGELPLDGIVVCGLDFLESAKNELR